MAGTMKSMAESMLATPFSVKGGEGGNDLFGANDSFAAGNDASGSSARTLKTQIQEKEKELMTLGQHRVRILESQVEQLEDSVRAKDRELRSKDVELQSRAAELSGKERELREKQRELGDVREKLEKADKEGKAALAALRAHEDEQRALEAELRDLRSKFAAAERELGDRRRQARELEVVGAAADQKAQELLAQVTEAEQRAARAEEQGQRMAAAHAQQTQRMAEEADSRISQLQGELRQARAELAQKEAEATQALEDAHHHHREEWEEAERSMAAQYREKERDFARQMQAEMEERLAAMVERVRGEEMGEYERRVAQLEEQLHGCQHTIEQQAHDLDMAAEEAASLHAAMRALEADRDAVADASARMQGEFRSALQAKEGDTLHLLDHKVEEMEAMMAERDSAHEAELEAVRAERQQLEERFDAFLADKEAEFADVMAQRAAWQEEVEGMHAGLTERIREREDEIAALQDECGHLQGVVRELEGQLARERGDAHGDMEDVEDAWRREVDAVRREWEEEVGRLGAELRLVRENESVLAEELEARTRELEEVEGVWKDRLSSVEAALQRVADEAAAQERAMMEDRVRRLEEAHDEEVEVLDRRCAELHAQLNEATMGRTPRVDTGDAELVKELRVALEKAHGSLDAYSEELKASLRREGAVSQQCEGLQADLADLRRHSEDYAAQQDEKCQLLTQQCAALEAHNKTLQAALGEMRREDAIVRELQAEVTRLQEQVARTVHEAELASSKREQELAAREASWAQERERLAATHAELMRTQAETMERTQQQQAAALSEAEQAKGALGAEVERLHTALAALKSNKDAVDQLRKQAEARVAESEAHITDMQQELRSLKESHYQARVTAASNATTTTEASSFGRPSADATLNTRPAVSVNNNNPSGGAPTASYSGGDASGASRRRASVAKSPQAVEADVRRLRDQIASLEQSFAAQFQPRGDSSFAAAASTPGFPMPSYSSAMPYGFDAGGARVASPKWSSMGAGTLRDFGAGNINAAGASLDAFPWRAPNPIATPGPASAPAFTQASMPPYSTPAPPQAAPVGPTPAPALNAATGTLDYLSGRLSALHQHMSAIKPAPPPPPARVWEPGMAPPPLGMTGGMPGTGLSGTGLQYYGAHASAMPTPGVGATPMAGAGGGKVNAAIGPMEAEAFASPYVGGSAWPAERWPYRGQGMPYGNGVPAGRSYVSTRPVASQQPSYASGPKGPFGSEDAGFGYPLSETMARSPRVGGGADTDGLLQKNSMQDAIGRIMLAKATLESAHQKSAMELQGQRTRLKTASKLISALK
eukprot:jgi/Mesvir1/22581/Mv05004-RA.1